MDELLLDPDVDDETVESLTLDDDTGTGPYFRRLVHWDPKARTRGLDTRYQFDGTLIRTALRCKQTDP